MKDLLVIVEIPEDAATDDISFELEFVFIDDHSVLPAKTSKSVIIKLLGKDEVASDFDFLST